MCSGVKIKIKFIGSKLETQNNRIITEIAPGKKSVYDDLKFVCIL